MKNRVDATPFNVLFERAAALHQQGDVLQAEKLYRTLLDQRPTHFRTLYNLADLLLNAGRPGEAVRWARKALNQEPNSAGAHAMLASALQDSELYEEALKHARRAVAADPGFAPAHSIVAWTLALLGRYDEAVEAQLRAVELAPENAFHYYQLGVIRRWTANDPCLSALENLAQKSESLSILQRIYVEFALAKASADCNDLERAFRHQIRGGALKRQTLNYNEAATFRFMHELCAGIDAEWVKRHSRAGDPSALPIFIVGMPRSGTTLVEQILASHPKVQARGERLIFEQSLHQAVGTSALPVALGQIAAQWSDADLRKIGERYLVALRGDAPASKTRITDKLPANFRFVGLIHAALPNARIIHTVRDPVDTCLSMFSMLFPRGHQGYSYDLGELGRHYRAYERTMEHWHGVLPSGVILDVRYEDVVDDVEQQARRIVAHCGLEWDDRCLEFYKNERPVGTSSHSQVRQPIYRSSVGRQRPPQELLQPLLTALESKPAPVRADLAALLPRQGAAPTQSPVFAPKNPVPPQKQPTGPARVKTALQRIEVVPDDRFNRAHALEEKGDLEGSEKLYRAVLKQHPDHFGTLFNLAEVLKRMGRGEEAAPILRKALKQDQDSAIAHVRLAQALQILEQHDDALKHANRAIELDPKLEDAHATLADTLAELGRHEEARAALMRAIELSPHQPQHHFQLGHMTRWTADDPRLKTLEALAERSRSLPEIDQIYLHFALGKAYSDCGDLERALRHQIEGAGLKRQTYKYDETATFLQLDELCRTLDEAWMRQHAGVGDPSPVPIFILGMPRSGTTLVEQILASHPKVRALGERPHFERAIARTNRTVAVPNALARIAAEWPSKELRRLGARYLASAAGNIPSLATRVTDKMPLNFRYVGLIHAALPNAHIIHTRRDPIDTCLSIFSLLFGGTEQPYSYDLGELGRYYSAYEKMMAHWRSVVPLSAMIDVQYEDVVADLEGQARRIIEHCELEWDDRCLEFYKTDRAVRTASHAQVRQPIYNTSVARPRPPRELLLPLLDAVGEA